MFQVSGCVTILSKTLCKETRLAFISGERCCLCMRKILIKKLQEVVGLLCHAQFKSCNRSNSEMEIAVLSIYDLKVSVSESFSEFSGRRRW